MTRCPECESGNTVKILLQGYYGIVAIPEVQRKKLIPKSSRVYAYACTKCGRIFNLTLENPELFTPFVTAE